jgi:hypothetical protein
MRKKIVLVVLMLFVAENQSLRAAPVQSGPPTGAKVPGPFRPLHVTGPDAGQRVCLYCKYGSRPVALVFTREVTPAVARLLARLDAAVAARNDARLGSFAVFLGDLEKLRDPLKQLATNASLQNVILTTDESAPESYSIAQDAAVTVLLYTKGTVKANHAFRAGELTDPAIDAILTDLDRMLPPK